MLFFPDNFKEKIAKIRKDWIRTFAVLCLVIGIFIIFNDMRAEQVMTLFKTLETCLNYGAIEPNVF